MGIPLFKIPTNAVELITQLMDTFTLILLPLCSKKTKHLVKSMEHDVKVICFTVATRPRVVIFRGDDNKAEIYLTLDNAKKQRENHPLNEARITAFTVYLSDFDDDEDEKEEFKVSLKDGILIKDWITAMMSCSSLDVIKNLKLGGYSQYDPLSIKKIFGESKIREIFYMEGVTGCYARAVLHDFLTARSVIVNSETYDEDHSDERLRLLSRNYDRLQLRDDNHLKFDELISCNAVNIDIGKNHILAAKDLNRYLRMWMKGSFRRLQILTVQFEEEVVLNNEVVLAKIPYQDGPRDDRRRTILTEDYLTLLVEGGGFEIRSNDGRRGTVNSNGNCYKFEFVVWD